MTRFECEQPRTLRVMRFGFEPNPTLLEQLRAQLMPTKRLDTPIRLYASSQLLISLEDYEEYQDTIVEVGKNFSAHTARIGVGPRLDSRPIKKTSITRLHLQPSFQGEFDALIGGINELPNRIPDQPRVGHYIFADVPTAALQTGSDRNVARDNFTKTAKRILYGVEATRFLVYRDITRDGTPTRPPITFDDLPKTG